MTFTYGSLFAGIGGFDLGLDRAGWKCKWQVEIDVYCRRVLKKHWPHVPRWGDIRTIWYRSYVDMLVAGFPCQDLSAAGKREGIRGERSGLFFETCRIIRLVRPRWVLLENVSALLAGAWNFGAVLGELAACGYDVEWDCLPAAAVGAPHQRDRVFILAHAQRDRLQGREHAESRERASGMRRRFAHTGGPQYMADASSTGLEERHRVFAGGSRPYPTTETSVWWATEPDVGRVANGVPARVDRIKGLGNAVMPALAEWLGRRIQEAS